MQKNNGPYKCVDIVLENVPNAILLCADNDKENVVIVIVINENSESLENNDIH